MDPAIIAIIVAAAQDTGIPPGLAIALVQVESNGNPRAVSSAGAKGLFQLMPNTGRKYGLFCDEDFFNPVKNAQAGCNFLYDLRTRFGEWWRVLAAYNWGPGRVTRSAGWHEWPDSVIKYVEKVYRLWRGPKQIAPVQISKKEPASIILPGGLPG